MTDIISETTNSHSGKVIVKNTVINLVGQILPLFVGIATIPMLIKGLGTDRFGILTLAWMVIGYFSLFDLGLGRALTQIISQRLGKGEARDLPGLVWTALAIMAITGVIGTVIAGVISPILIANVFKMPDQLRPETLKAFYILSASIPIIILSSGFVGILSAYQRFDLINAVRMPLGLANFIAPLLVLQFTTSLVPITFLLALCRLATCIAQFWLCLRVMPILRTEKHFISEAVKPLFSFGGWMTVSNIVGPLMVYLDRFIIGAVISVTAVAYYATPYEMVTKIWIVSGALISSLFPVFAAYKNNDASHTIQIVTKSFAAIFIFIFPIVLIIVTFSQEGLSLWLGKDFANNSTHVLQWLAAGVFINCLAQVVFVLIQGRGRPDITAKIHLMELTFYLPLLWWALKNYGIAGAAVAWTLRITIDGILLLWASQRLILFPRKLTIKISGCAIVASILLAISAFPNSLTIRSIYFGITSFIFAVFSLLYLRRIGIHGLMTARANTSEETHTP
jgi:O-antigen/teichoic acid export membrane protein